MKDADSRLALVTGASSGIGLACAKQLRRAGYRVLAGMRSPLRDDLFDDAADIVPISLDVTSEADLSRLPDLISNHYSAGLDVLVNNAGVGLGGPLETASVGDIERTIATNLTGAILATRVCLPALIKVAEAGGSPSIVLVGSLQSHYGLPNLSVYSATKFGVRGFADALRVELSGTGVRVVAVDPGSIATPIWQKGARQLQETIGRSSPAIVERYGLKGFAEAMARVASRGLDAEVVAAFVERAVRSPRPRARYLVGRDARISSLASRLLPTGQRDALARRMTGIPRLRR